jgi:hypothetical protein
MHNDTPLGAMMHLKELDRYASPKLHPRRARKQDAFPVSRVRAAMIAVLRRLHAVGILGRAVSQGQSHS